MSALAERTNGHRPLTVVEQPRTLDAYGRLEALCDPGSLQVIRSTILPRRESKRMQAGRRRGRRLRHGRRAARVLLRAGPGLRGRRAGRGPRRHDHPRDGDGRAGRGPGGRLHRLRRRAHGRRRCGARRLRAHLPPQRAAVGQGPADLGDQRRVGRRRLLLAGAHRLRGHDRGLGHVPHRPRRGRGGHGREGGRRGPGRLARALAQRRLPVRDRRRHRRRAARARPALLPAPARGRRRSARGALAGAGHASGQRSCPRRSARSTTCAA